jgi:hypothetical protein
MSGPAYGHTQSIRTPVFKFEASFLTPPVGTWDFLGESLSAGKVFIRGEGPYFSATASGRQVEEDWVGMAEVGRVMQGGRWLGGNGAWR